MIQAPPFSVEQATHHIKNIFRCDTAIVALATLLAVIVNHVNNAPSLWKGLAILSLFGVFADIITGTIRSCYIGSKKRCPHKVSDCERRTKTGGCGFNSRDLGATFVKLMCYLAFSLLATGADLASSWILNDGTTKSYALSIVALAMIAFREVQSNFENGRDIFKCLKEPFPFKKLEDKINSVIPADCLDEKEEKAKDTDNP